MQPDLKTNSVTKSRLRAVLGGVLTMTLLLSVPVFAVTTLASWGRTATPQPVIESADDAVANGFRIVKKESEGVVPGKSQLGAVDRPGEKVLREWRYTRDKTGSPGH